MSRLVHICICAAYREGWGYQENILPQKHKELGYDVHLITYNQEFKDNVEIKSPSSYMNKRGFRVHILKNRTKSWIDNIPKIRAISALSRNKTVGLYEKLVELAPDIIFIHGVHSHDHYSVIRYAKKHSNVRIYVDNHCDYYNTPVKGIWGKLLKYTYYRKIGRALSNYARIMWGVTPWRVAYLNDVYAVPKNKTKLLVMGGDEALIDFNNKSIIKGAVRNSLGITKDTFVVISGGKIDKAKNIHVLAQAINELADKNIKLLIFGKKTAEMESLKQFSSPYIIDIGWIKSDACYELFLASDLAVFPGTHSVLWEQVCATGIPAIFKDWQGGFSHVNVGGNAILLEDVSVDSLKQSIKSVYNTERYNHMKIIAEDIARKKFSYLNIAKEAVEYYNFEGSNLIK